MRKYRFLTCDVFTGTRFGGNPLAVLPDAAGLTDRQMQQIAREFNLSETTFVFPPEAGHTRKVRIFTPFSEVPFAGHPNVGTAFVLAATGALGRIRSGLSVTFEEKAGLVPITIREEDGRIVSCELKAPQPVSFGEAVPAALVATAVSLPPEDIVTATHGPQVVSVGLEFVMAELRDRAALEAARIDTRGFEAIRDRLHGPLRASVYLYVRGTDGGDLRARMFAPLSGVPEDPATGSAGCAVAGLLAQHDARDDGELTYRIAQGVEMGRPSSLQARVEKHGGEVTGIRIAGSCVLVSEGHLEIQAP